MSAPNLTRVHDVSGHTRFWVEFQEAAPNRWLARILSQWHSHEPSTYQQIFIARSRQRAEKWAARQLDALRRRFEGWEV